MTSSNNINILVSARISLRCRLTVVNTGPSEFTYFRSDSLIEITLLNLSGTVVRYFLNSLELLTIAADGLFNSCASPAEILPSEIIFSF